MRTTLKSVNEALAGLGAQARLMKGDGYFYFDSGEAENWLDKTISTRTLSSRTVDEWVQEYHRLKELNRKLLEGSPRRAHSSAPKRSEPAKSRRP
jgi:hypothetical protein